jgi:hypothetical protein
MKKNPKPCNLFRTLMITSKAIASKATTSKTISAKVATSKTIAKKIIT